MGTANKTSFGSSDLNSNNINDIYNDENRIDKCVLLKSDVLIFFHWYVETKNGFVKKMFGESNLWSDLDLKKKLIST